MSSILSSQGLAIATAMVVSSTALFLAFSKHNKINPILSKSTLLSSDDKKREKNKNKNKKKKKVRFAEDVKEPKGNGEDYRKKHNEKKAMAQRTSSISTTTTNCRNEIPANRVALYNGILKQRSQRIQCSF